MLGRRRHIQQQFIWLTSLGCNWFLWQRALIKKKKKKKKRIHKNKWTGKVFLLGAAARRLDCQPEGRRRIIRHAHCDRNGRASVTSILSIRSTVAVVLYTKNQWLFFYMSSLFCLVSWTSTTAGGLRWPTDSMFGFANPWSRLFINPRHSTCNSPRSVRSVRPSLHGRRQIHWRIAADAQRIGSIALKLTAGDVEERTLLPKRNKEASPTSIYIYYI